MTAHEIHYKHLGEALNGVLKHGSIAAIQEGLNEGRKEVSLQLYQCKEELDELKQVHHLKTIENNSLHTRLAELEEENKELKKLINTRTFNIIHKHPKLPTGGGML